MDAPDILTDPEGYALWCEMHACPNCDGTGEVEGDFEFTDSPVKCPVCDGSCIDPDR